MGYRDDEEARRIKSELALEDLRDAKAELERLKPIAARVSELETAIARMAPEIERARRAALPQLSGVRVASPCSEAWERMEGDERVRHCGRCEKVVYNLTAMTSAQAEALLASRSGAMCVRYFQRRDGTVMTTDCPVGIRRRRTVRGAAAAVAAGVAAAAWMSSHPTAAPSGAKDARATRLVALEPAADERREADREEGRWVAGGLPSYSQRSGLSPPRRLSAEQLALIEARRRSVETAPPEQPERRRPQRDRRNER
jgi:hypothetical protein